MRKAIAAVSALVALTLVNVMIAGKESVLAHGRLVYLELVPVDPRSLMQGDYMALRFAIAGDISASAHADADGRIVAGIDDRSIGRFKRLDDGRPLAADEIALRYRTRDGQIKFGTNAFFFQEGTGSLHAGARYGEFRVAPNGDMLLVGLRNAGLERLGPPPSAMSHQP